MVARLCSGKHTPRPRRTIAVTGTAVPSNRMVWDPENCSCAGGAAFMLYANLYAFTPRHPRRRAILDAIASPSECRDTIGAAILSMAGLGGGTAEPAQTQNGETAVAVQVRFVLMSQVSRFKLFSPASGTLCLAGLQCT